MERLLKKGVIEAETFNGSSGSGLELVVGRESGDQEA